MIFALSANPDKEAETFHCLADAQVVFPHRQAGYLTDHLTGSFLKVPRTFQMHIILEFQPYLKEMRSVFLDGREMHISG